MKTRHARHQLYYLSCSICIRGGGAGGAGGDRAPPTLSTLCCRISAFCNVYPFSPLNFQLAPPPLCMIRINVGCLELGCCCCMNSWSISVSACWLLLVEVELHLQLQNFSVLSHQVHAQMIHFVETAKHEC